MKPTKAGYASYEVRPTLGGLAWMEGTIPTPNGEIRVKMDQRSISVYATEGEGVLYLPTGGDPIRIECGKELTINY